MIEQGLWEQFSDSNIHALPTMPATLQHEVSEEAESRKTGSYCSYCLFFLHPSSSLYDHKPPEATLTLLTADGWLCRVTDSFESCS